MNEDAHAAAIERIDLALARIERAAQARAFEHHAIGHRHDALKARLHDAIVALDAVISREEGRD